MTQADARGEDWPLRLWLTSGLLALCGLAVWLFLDQNETSPWRTAGAAFFIFGGVSASLTLSRTGWREAGAFSLAAGLVMAGLAYHAIGAGDHVAGEEFGFAAGVFALLLALPLFQAGFARTRFATPYRDTHFHVWTDAVSGAGAFAFTGLSWLVLAVLAQLFLLLKIDLLDKLMNKEWFGWTFSGAAFGAGMGTLRNQVRVLGTLRHVVMLVLSLLAVPTALGLLVFLAAMVVSGPDVLWEATRRATPVLLSAAAGAFVLVNAIIREDDAEMSRNAVMRLAALALAAMILPLTVFAAVSMGTRIAQHGLSPARIWGLIAIATACAYGLAAFVAVLRGRMKGWPEKLRQANLNLAGGLSAVALFLALPLLDFGAISTRDQLHRLAGGAVSAKDFDYNALRWEFGDAGREALKKLAGKGGEPAQFAKDALAEADRYRPIELAPDEAAPLDNRIADPQLHLLAERYHKQEPWECREPCIALDAGTKPDGTVRLVFVGPNGALLRELRVAADGALVRIPDVAQPAIAPGARVEIRPYQGRQVWVNGKPAGQPFE